MRPPPTLGPRYHYRNTGAATLPSPTHPPILLVLLPLPLQLSPVPSTIVCSGKGSCRRIVYPSTCDLTLGADAHEASCTAPTPTLLRFGPSMPCVSYHTKPLSYMPKFACTCGTPTHSHLYCSSSTSSCPKYSSARVNLRRTEEDGPRKYGAQKKGGGGVTAERQRSKRKQSAKRGGRRRGV